MSETGIPSALRFGEPGEAPFGGLIELACAVPFLEQKTPAITRRGHGGKADGDDESC